MGESKLIFLKTEERRCDALSKLKINQMTFNMNMFEKSVNEEKATLDDEYTTFSAASYFVPFISHVAVFIICKFRNTKIPCQTSAPMLLLSVVPILCVE